MVEMIDNNSKYYNPNNSYGGVCYSGYDPWKYSFDPPKSLFYFAYGSNMSRSRMASRGVYWEKAMAGTLEGHTLKFNKDSGSKGTGYANIVKSKTHRVEGILYKLEDVYDTEILDMYEGYPDHYERKEIKVIGPDGKKIDAFVYKANPKKIKADLKPTKSYLAYLLAGSKYLSKEYHDWLKLTEISEKAKQTLRVFVYGTLKRGHGNHANYCLKSRSVENAVLAGRLYDSGLPYVHVETGDQYVDGSKSVSEDFKMQEELQNIVKADDCYFTDPSPDNACGIVHGELVTYDNWDAITGLDRLEGFNPKGRSHYKRILTTCRNKAGEEVSCWVYVVDEKEMGFKKSELNVSGIYNGWTPKSKYPVTGYDGKLDEEIEEELNGYLDDGFYDAQKAFMLEEEEEELKARYPELYAKDNAEMMDTLDYFKRTDNKNYDF